MKRRLSRETRKRGCVSFAVLRRRPTRGTARLLHDAGCKRKKSLVRSLAVICGGTERTHDASASLPLKRGTRLAKTMRRENAQNHGNRPRHAERGGPFILRHACGGILTQPIKNSPHS